MRKTLAILGVTAMTAFWTGPLQADEGRVQHYEPKPAPNLAQAVKNLREYNAILDDLLSQELTPETMDKIHQVSYTLENALKRVDKDLDSIANVLEGMHLASESMKPEDVKNFGNSYLKGIRTVVSEQ